MQQTMDSPSAGLNQAKHTQQLPYSTGFYSTTTFDTNPLIMAPNYSFPNNSMKKFKEYTWIIPLSLVHHLYFDIVIYAVYKEKWIIVPSIAY